MATTVNLKKILDLKRWEMISPAPVATVAGATITNCRHVKQLALFNQAVGAQYLYNPSEDGWITLPSGAMGGTVAAGAVGAAHMFSTGATVGAASLTATGGTTTTLITNQTLARDLRGFSIHILSGPGAGDVRTIASNTVGANATITVSSAFSATPTASTAYRLITPRWYLLNTGILAAGQFKVYDYATNTWQSLSTTGLPATVGTSGSLVSTPSWLDSGFLQFATGTATSGTATTLVNSAKTWTASQWINYQIRIVSGTGAGQIRTITANDATSVTVATWTTIPDATSVYSIEGNDDFLYYMGSGAVTLYRYQISTNTWSTLSPVAARAGAPSTGTSGNWVYGVTDSAWTSESTIKNGSRIYSFRGGAVGTLDYYDIAANTWVSGITYSPANETFTTGSKYAYLNDAIYIQKDAQGRWFKYNLITNEMEGWNTLLYPNSTGIDGSTAWEVVYTDGATKIYYIYMTLNSLSISLRQMVI